jgi:hypothetical protein
MPTTLTAWFTANKELDDPDFFFFELGFRVPVCIATRLSYSVQDTN